MEIHPPGFREIEHFFVLMLENRSFDHMLGADPTLQRMQPALTGLETYPYDPQAPGMGSVHLSLGAPDIVRPDPPHEFRDVCYQMSGHDDGQYAGRRLAMNGFAASARRGVLQGGSNSRSAVAARGNGSYALACHGHGSIGVLRTLAREYAVCENWFSSMPGPTWPNRFFVHAATSGGLDNSPSTLRAGASVIIDELGFEFDNGTIFELLGPGRWRIYHDDALPQVLAIKGMIKDRFYSSGPIRFRRLKHLSRDLGQPEFAPNYVFIEPDYDVFRDSRNGNSQHPEGRVTAGERLIRDVYLALRDSPIWNSSALIIAYDEHGGFCDRVAPPKATPPGDSDRNRRKAKYPAGFDFTLFGPRVPAVVVSPWIPRNTVDSRIHDHTSILRTVIDRFQLQSLTARERAANSLESLFQLERPRDDRVDFGPIPEEVLARLALPDPVDDFAQVQDGEDVLSGAEAGFIRIATAVDRFRKGQLATPGEWLRDRILGSFLPDFAIGRAPEITNRNMARQYYAQVVADVDAFDENTPGH